MITREEYTAKIDEYLRSLRNSEKSNNTIKQYKLGINTFKDYADTVSNVKAPRTVIISYKKYLEKKYKLTTANLYIIALNNYLKYIKKSNMCLETFKMQEQTFTLENSLTMEEYIKMADVAKNKKNDTIYYIMVAIAGTGIRISELKYITVEALRVKGGLINNKGKSRFIPISETLSSILMDYCKKNDIKEGYVFFAKDKSKPINRVTVSRKLKKIALLAGIDESKAYPHNFRHLFAKRYMQVIGNITGLKNILGHSDIKSTLIYTSTTNDEKRKDMDKLGFY